MKKRRTLLKRAAGLALALSMVCTMTPAPVQAAEPVTDNLLVHYDMSHKDGYLTDVSGKGNNAKLNNIDDSDFTNRLGDDILELPGTDGAYAELPLSIAQGLNYDDGFSVEVTFIPQTNQHQFLWTLGTGRETDCLFFNPKRPDDVLFVGIKAPGTDGSEAIEQSMFSDEVGTDAYTTVTVTSEGQTLKMYVNGEEKASVTHTRELDAIFKGDGSDILGYIGRSNFPLDPYCDSIVTDFKMYSTTLTEEQVKQNYEDAAESQTLYSAAESLSLPSYTFENLTLPTDAGSGVSVDWSSSASGVLDENGVIHAGDSDQDVTLTAVFSLGNKRVSRDYVVTVVAAGDEGRIKFLTSQFDLGISYVTEDITLPSEYNGVSIAWTGNELISANGEVTRPDEDTEVVLKAVFTYNDASLTKEFPVTVAAKPAGYLATYIAEYEVNLGAEEALKPVDFDEDAPNNYTDNERTDVMHYALSADGEEYTALNNGKAVLYPDGMYKMGSPSLFRKPDGTYGAIASVDNNSTEILVYDSDDLIFFENQRRVELNQLGIVVKNPTVKYDNGNLEYIICWEGGDGNSYKSVTKDFSSFSEPEQTDYTKATVTGSLPDYARAEESAQFELTAEEYTRLENKFGDIYSTAVSGQVVSSDENGTTEKELSWNGENTNEISVKTGSELTLPEQIQVLYSDGSDADMNVEWDASKLNLNEEGTYTVTGTVSRTEYESPLIECRADPYIIYNEQDGMYYFTASYMNDGDDVDENGNLRGHYDSIILRRASTIEGLTDAEEVQVWWHSRNNEEAPGAYWAPELHYFGGKWRIISMAGWGANRQGLFTCTGGDMMDPDNWEFTGYMDYDGSGHDIQTSRLNTFDTTYFELNGTCYYVTPRDGIKIATFDPDNPTTLTSDVVTISQPTLAFEHNVLTGQNIQEGSAVLFHDDKVFIAYACATVDQFYATNVLYADVDSNLLDPDSWSKYPYPLLSTVDLTQTSEDGEYTGAFGPGHNSFTVDENGNPVIVYHARAWGESWVENDSDRYGLFDPGRHAYVNGVHFGADGFPIFNMTAEQLLSSDLEIITLEVQVTESPEEQEPGGEDPGQTPGGEDPGQTTGTDDPSDGSGDAAGSAEGKPVQTGDTSNIGLWIAVMAAAALAAGAAAAVRKKRNR